MRISVLFVAMLVFSLLASFALADEKSIQITSSVTPSSVSPGNNGYITLSITNSGTLSVDKLKVYADTSLPLDATYLDMGRLASLKSTSAIFKFSVPSSTKPDFYTAKFTVEYCYENDCRENIHHAVINVKEVTSLELVSLTPDSLKTGRNETITFKLKNNGGDISNLVFVWEEPNDMILPLGTDNRKFVPHLGSGGSYDIEVNALANPEATIGLYPISVQMTYDDRTGTRQSINSTIGMRVVGDFDFVSLLESQDILAAGKTGNAEIKTVNRGDLEAKFLTLSLSSDSFYIDPDYVYIGNTKPDDYDTEKLWLTTKNVPSGNYPLNVELSYKDTYGNSYTETQSIDIYVSSPEAYAASQPQASYDWLYFIIFLVVAYILYRKFWKKKKK